MINRYYLTDDMIKKCTRIGWKNYLIYYLVMEGLLLFVSFFAFIYFMYFIFLLLMLIVGFSIYLTFAKINKQVKTDIDLSHKCFGNQPPLLNIEFRDQIYMSLNGFTEIIYYANIIKYNDNDELIVIKMKDKKMLVLRKDSFVVGTYEECIDFLDKLV